MASVSKILFLQCGFQPFLALFFLLQSVIIHSFQITEAKPSSLRSMLLCVKLSRTLCSLPLSPPCNLFKWGGGLHLWRYYSCVWSRDYTGLSHTSCILVDLNTNDPRTQMQMRPALSAWAAWSRPCRPGVCMAGAQDCSIGIILTLYPPTLRLWK